MRVIIPLGAGGGGDIFTRALTDELQKRLGQTFVVENRTGGGLNIGTRACAEAAPDGYTICVLSSEPIVYSQFLFKSLPFNPEKDFEPITNLFFNTLAFAVNPSLKVKTVPGADRARQDEPGKLSYSTFSFPLAHFMDEAQEAARRRHRARALPQRQRGDDGAPVGRDADHAARPGQHGPAVAERARSRRLRSMPIRARRCFPTSRRCRRRPATSYPQSWFGLFAPAGTPKPIIDKLNAEVAAHHRRAGVPCRRSTSTAPSSARSTRRRRSRASSSEDRATARAHRQGIRRAAGIAAFFSCPKHLSDVVPPRRRGPSTPQD